MNLIDRVFSYFAPSVARSRALARYQMQGILKLSSRSYDGASKAPRLSGWRPSDKSANELVRGTAETLRSRARDLRRNNAYAARAIQVISTNMVGDGIRPQINHERNAKLTLKTAMDRWSDWSETTYCDLEGRVNIYQMQSIVADAVPESGEIFVIRHRLPKTENGQVPLKVQMLEADYLAVEKNETLEGGSFISQGIEFDSSGRPLAYHFHKTHPGESVLLGISRQETFRITADRVAHVYRMDRPHQRRGITWLAPVMLRLRELDIMQDATLKKQQLSACLAAYITTTEDLEEDQVELYEKLEPGSVTTLGPGMDVKFSDPPSASDYPEFVKVELRAIASGMGITFEALTNDLSGVNFSSGRMGFIEMNRNIRRWQNEVICAQMMDKIFSWFAEALDLVTPGNMDMSRLWVRWTCPAREMIDPVKEVNAANDAIRSGQQTLCEVLRSRGKDPDTHFEERKRELELLTSLGIVTDSDPRQDAKPQPLSGSVNENEEDPDSDPEARP